MVDAMTGQDAVNVAKTFNEKLGVDGVILTKLDGDTRGGAALSRAGGDGQAHQVLPAWAKSCSDIEPFHPDRMASRILGMGDVLTPDRKGAAKPSTNKDAWIMLANRCARNAELTLEDYPGADAVQLKKMGPASRRCSSSSPA